jgi:hypothetical protein
MYMRFISMLVVFIFMVLLNPNVVLLWYLLLKLDSWVEVVGVYDVALWTFVFLLCYSHQKRVGQDKCERVHQHRSRPAMESTQTPWWSQTPRPSQLQHLALALISPPNTRTHKCLILLRIPSYSTRKQQNRPQDQVPWVFNHINKSDGTSRLLYNAHSYSTAEPPKIRTQPSHALHINLLQRLPVSY